MQQTTYDPVLEVQDLSPLRLLNPLRPPVPGRALVLVPYEGAAVTVWPGDTIPSARFGAWQTAFTVDTGDHRLILTLPLLSRDATFAFQSSLALTCRVIGPEAVVRRGIRDMSAALSDPLRKMLRQVSRHFDIAEFHEAEEALNDAVREFPGDDAIRLSGMQVELLVDADEVASSGRHFRDVVRETRLEGMRRQRHLDMLRADGVEGLIAEILEKEGPTAAWTYIEKAEEAERAELRATLEMILKRGDKDREPFEIAEAERAVLGRVLGGSAAPFGGMRGSRVRGSALPPAPTPEEPREVPSHAYEYLGSEDSTAEEKRASESYDYGMASMSPETPSPHTPIADGPPEDEPIGSDVSAGTPSSHRYDPRPRSLRAPEKSHPAPADDAGGTPPKASRVRGLGSAGPRGGAQ
ncbi:hypothetical protein [Streptomyces sp. TRM68367]|uniref:hypothetical protein n=1 Tax=Streptomyces sp. TRM68367 TaxID=2758415 RepID=UPI00165C3EC0|nr:hypothetical protein [Streptomyces sp. TRM68367]MBC9729378.1 hypothetical protein [Streptomyces sp. TRM68367]